MQRVTAAGPDGASGGGSRGGSAGPAAAVSGGADRRGSVDTGAAGQHVPGDVGTSAGGVAVSSTDLGGPGGLGAGTGPLGGGAGVSGGGGGGATGGLMQQAAIPEHRVRKFNKLLEGAVVSCARQAECKRPWRDDGRTGLLVTGICVLGPALSGCLVLVCPLRLGQAEP